MGTVHLDGSPVTPARVDGLNALADELREQYHVELGAIDLRLARMKGRRDLVRLLHREADLHAASVRLAALAPVEAHLRAALDLVAQPPASSLFPDDWRQTLGALLRAARAQHHAYYSDEALPGALAEHTTRRRAHRRAHDVAPTSTASARQRSDWAGVVLRAAYREFDRAVRGDRGRTDRGHHARVARLTGRYLQVQFPSLFASATDAQIASRVRQQRARQRRRALVTTPPK